MFASINWEDYTLVPNVLQNERAKREPFTSTFLPSSDPASIEKNIQTVYTLDKTTAANHDKIMAQFVDISNNIQSYLTTRSHLHDNNDKYHYDDQIDPNVIIKREPPNNIHTVIEKDLNTLTLNQNSIYISSAIACATLLIGAIMIAPIGNPKG